MNFSRSENFHDSDYLESMANEWTPEKSFRSEKLRKHKDGYPKPGLGIEVSKIPAIKLNIQTVFFSLLNY